MPSITIDGQIKDLNLTNGQWEERHKFMEEADRIANTFVFLALEQGKLPELIKACRTMDTPKMFRYLLNRHRIEAIKKAGRERKRHAKIKRQATEQKAKNRFFKLFEGLYS